MPEHALEIEKSAIPLDAETLFHAFVSSTQTHKQQTAYIYQAGNEEMQVTYSKVFEDVLLLARALSSKGVRQGRSGNVSF